MKTEMEAARDAAWEKESCKGCEACQFEGDGSCDDWARQLFVKGYDARGSQWVAVKSADDLPKEFDWYEVTVKETSSLGTFRYVDILSFGHSADCGNCWMNLPENGRVIAWRERSKPYTADSGQEGE